MVERKSSADRWAMWSQIREAGDRERRVSLRGECLRAIQHGRDLPQCSTTTSPHASFSAQTL
jgi:hypothetical protein